MSTNSLNIDIKDPLSRCFDEFLKKNNLEISDIEDLYEKVEEKLSKEKNNDIKESFFTYFISQLFCYSERTPDYEVDVEKLIKIAPTELSLSSIIGGFKNYIDGEQKKDILKRMREMKGSKPKNRSSVLTTPNATISNKIPLTIS